ncbi:MAG TPA: phage tail sheath subtilisin-like domain-containing protein [Phycisphaerales bacterium]|nr:phage tail sheath subtilisin-like domain-containing protein [Phycisphaerales bacterium]HMP38023.1 phage tail sheath subtilisin-like domain-containing protein [Phycisphaerales bacterium]
MASNDTAPGVHIEEIASGVRTITGVATSITAFIGRAPRGPVNEPRTIPSFADFERRFGGLSNQSTMSFAVRDFFSNGGGEAVIVRVYRRGAVASGSSESGAARFALLTESRQPEVQTAVDARVRAAEEAADRLELTASAPGAWGNSLLLRVDHALPDRADRSSFNLSVRDRAMNAVESFRNVSIAADSPRRVDRVLEQESLLVRVPEGAGLPAERPGETPGETPGATPGESAASPAEDHTARRPFELGSDGVAITDDEIVGSEAERDGLFALDTVDLFNLLCIPPLAADVDVAPDTWQAAAEYCRRRRAVLIIDPPQGWSRGEQARTGIESIGVSNSHAAIYFPRIRQANPLRANQIEAFAPCGAVAGVIARTDATRGVWKAPAGLDARITGISGFSTALTDAEIGELNPLGVNCLRTLPEVDGVVWGARTREGDDRLASEWKYLPVRRTALFIEESLWRGTQWVVFEPNDEPLWAQIRLNLGAFMNGLFRQGAFEGATPREAYFVKCDRETTTQNDINLGTVNILVGFAPLKPAEFVVIRIQRVAGQIAT